MRKKQILAPVLLVMTLSLHAIRPIHVAFPRTQSDGTTIKVYLHGDGYVAYYTTLDHKILVKNSIGNLCYAKLVDGKLVATDVIAHEIGSRTQDELAFLRDDTLSTTAPIVKKLELSRNIRKVAYASTEDGLGQYGLSSKGAVSSIGEITIPVIMVEFSDTKFQSTTTIDKMNRFYNEEGYNEESGCKGSVKDYFKAQSSGLFIPTFNVVAKVTLSNGYAYYGSDANGQDANALQMVKDAVSAAVTAGVDFSQFENTSGKIPLVSILYAGQGQATGGSDDTVWPHERDLQWYNNTMSGYTFGSYFVGNELYYDETLMGMGVFCHEFGHALGLPDFYDTSYSYSDDSPFGYWSIMDEGAYYPDGHARAPIGYDAYEKSYMGWLNIPEITTSDAITLENPNNEEGNSAVLIRNPNNTKEYFILENRQPGTWYPSDFGSGMLLTRFAYNQTNWAYNNLNNTDSLKRAEVVTADGTKIKESALQSQLYANGEANITSLTTYDGSSLTSIPFYKIIKHSNGTITFNAVDKENANQYKPLVGTIYEKVTDTSELAPNDTVIIVNEDESLALSTRQTGNKRSAININLNGSQIIADDDAQKLILRQTTNGEWGFYTGKVYLAASNSGLKTENNADANAIASIVFNNGDATVLFQGTATKNLLCYDSESTSFSTVAKEGDHIQIYKAVSTTTDDIKNISVQGDQIQKSIFNIAGQQVSKQVLQPGLYIVDGKKVVIK